MSTKFKSQLIKDLSKDTGQSFNTCRFVINSFIEIMKKELKNNEEIMIKDFGKFKQTLVNERIRYSPLTGEEYLEKEHSTIKFKCSKNFYKETLDGDERNRSNQH